jgi:hypothetical protein
MNTAPMTHGHEVLPKVYLIYCFTTKFPLMKFLPFCVIAQGTKVDFFSDFSQSSTLMVLP